MTTHGLIQTEAHGTIGWVGYIRGMDVLVHRGPTMMLLGAITSPNGLDFCGTLSVALSAGRPVVCVTAASEDECVEKLVRMWRMIGGSVGAQVSTSSYYTQEGE